jgi:hypothetical protein
VRIETGYALTGDAIKALLWGLRPVICHIDPLCRKVDPTPNIRSV